MKSQLPFLLLLCVSFFCDNSIRGKDSGGVTSIGSVSSVNDAICDAVDLGVLLSGGSFSTTSDNFLSNTELDDTGATEPGSENDESVWFMFATNTIVGNYYVNVSPNTLNYCPYAALYEAGTSSCAGGDPTLFDDFGELVMIDEFVSTEAIAINMTGCLEPNTTYYIQVDGVYIAGLYEEGEFDLTVTDDGASSTNANNDICQAEDLGTLTSGLTLTTSDDNFCADTEVDDLGVGEPGTENDKSVWFTFMTGPVAGNYNVEVSPTGLLYSPYAAIYMADGASCSSSDPALFDDFSILTMINEFASTAANPIIMTGCLQPNTTYYVQVDGVKITGLVDEGSFDLIVIDDGASSANANDNICFAEDLGVIPNGGSATTSDNNECVFQELDDNGVVEPGTENDESVWFMFTTGSFAGNYSVTISPNDLLYAPYAALYEAGTPSCAFGDPILFDDFSILKMIDEFASTSAISIIMTGCLLPNKTYYVQVDGVTITGLTDQGTFDLTVTNEWNVTNTNNEICQAEDLGTIVSGGTLATFGDNYCASTELDDLGTTEPGASNDESVWFTFTTGSAIGNVNVNVNPTGLLYRPYAALYEANAASCAGGDAVLFDDFGALTMLADAAAPTELYDLNFFECLKPNTTYYIQVDGVNSGKGNFDLKVTDSGNNANDAICSAEDLGTIVSGGTLAISGDNYCASAELDDLGIGELGSGNGESVWFTFSTGSVTGGYNIYLEPLGLATLYAAIYVADGSSCASGDPELFDDFSTLTMINELTSIASEPIIMTGCLSPNTTYYIQVDGVTNTGFLDQGWFDLTIKDVFVDEFQTDSLELIKIYNACNGPSWNQTWDLNTPISTWNGISLSPDGCNVIGIDFGFFGNGLTGTFPSVNLPELETLILTRNDLRAIGDFSGIPKLKTLELSNNQLSEIPTLSPLTSLENLAVGYNQLTEVPDYSNLSNLVYLFLNNNLLESVPDYADLLQLEHLHLADNRLAAIPDYTGLNSLISLSVNGNRLNFSDILPSTANSFAYEPQDSIALLGLGQNTLAFPAGGDLGDNTYSWYLDGALVATISADSIFSPVNPGVYHCEATNDLLPSLTLYSSSIYLCGNNLVADEFLTVSPAPTSPICSGTELTFSVYNIPFYTANYARYVFIKNGIVLQDSPINSLVVSDVQNGDVFDCRVLDDNGCNFFTNSVPFNVFPTPTIGLCQTNPITLNVKLLQGEEPWQFDLVEFEQGNSSNTETIVVTNGTSSNITTNPNSQYEIRNLTDANCTIETSAKSSFIEGCSAVCVGYSDPQTEVYSSIFNKYVDPSSIYWEVFPADATINGDVTLLSGLNNFYLELDFSNPSPTYSQIFLRVSADSDCGTEVLEYSIQLDPDCVWPGDVNKDGQVITGGGFENIPWIDDAIGLTSAITQASAYPNPNNETLISYPRNPGCLASKTSDWFPQSAQDWQIQSFDGSLTPALFNIYDLNYNPTATFNLKFADCNGDSELTDDVNWIPFSGPFSSVANPSDHDVIAYQAFQESRHDGNAPAQLINNNLDEILTIIAPDSVFNSGDELVFQVVFADDLVPIQDVVQLAFSAEGTFGSYYRPTVDLFNSAISNSPADMADYSFALEDASGTQNDSLLVFSSIHTPNMTPMTAIAGQEVCKVICRITIIGLTGQNPTSKSAADSISFKIPLVGIGLPDGRILYGESNEVTLSVNPEPQLDARIILEGAFDSNTGLMRDLLRSRHLLPISEPYSGIPSYYFPRAESQGIELNDSLTILSVEGANAIVDWVFVEVRNPTDTSLLSTTPALVTRSGNVVAMDGISPLSLPRVPYGSYYILIRHRNHLPVMTLSPIQFDRGITSIDFTTGNNCSIQAEIAPSIFGLAAGDQVCTHEACLYPGFEINGVDNISWYENNGLYEEYNNSDYDLNTDVNGLDKILWIKNNGLMLRVPRF